MHSHFWASIQRRLYRIRREFGRLWKNYFYQSFLAAVVVFIVLLLLNMEHAVVIAVLTSSIVLSLAHRFSKRFLRDLT